MHIVLTTESRSIGIDEMSVAVLDRLTFSSKLSGNVFDPTSRLMRNVFQSVCLCSIPKEQSGIGD